MKQTILAQFCFIKIDRYYMPKHLWKEWYVYVSWTQLFISICIEHSILLNHHVMVQLKQKQKITFHTDVWTTFDFVAFRICKRNTHTDKRNFELAIKSDVIALALFNLSTCIQTLSCSYFNTFSICAKWLKQNVLNAILLYMSATLFTE